MQQSGKFAGKWSEQRSHESNEFPQKNATKVMCTSKWVRVQCLNDPVLLAHENLLSWLIVTIMASNKWRQICWKLFSYRSCYYELKEEICTACKKMNYFFVLTATHQQMQSVAFFLSSQHLLLFGTPCVCSKRTDFIFFSLPLLYERTLNFPPE